MQERMKKRITTKNALALSVCLFLLWVLLGANTTVAWFTDTAAPVTNTFIVGDMHLMVFYKNDVITEYTPVQENTSIFPDRALYEPGYTQVVYLKIENAGTVAFDYKLAVDASKYTKSINHYGSTFCLPPYLRFGVVFGASEAELERRLARENADNEMGAYTLNTYSRVDPETVAAGDIRYAALVIYMPEQVGNEANHSPDVLAPQVDLGVTVFAQQAGTDLS